MAWQFLDDISGQGVTKDTRFDEREIVLKIRQLMNEVLALKLFDKYNEGDRGALSIYIASYPLILQRDTANDRAYVTLPEFYTGLPYNRGIHRIFLKKKQYKDIIISHNPGIGQNVGAGNVHGEFYAYIEGFTMVFRNIAIEPDTLDDDKTIVVQLLIAAPDKIAMDDALPIIPEQQNEILKRLMIQYRPTPQDPTNNGNKDI